ncbi:MAG: stalk domain-containing protein [Eubacteriales bacterium]|nr:stalk domain-containing protein [Eubacteriales bacterium]
MKRLNKVLASSLALMLVTIMLSVSPFAQEAAAPAQEVAIHHILDDAATPYSVLDSQYVRHLGRGEVTEKGYSMNWSMSGIEFEFTGTTAEVEVVTNDKSDQWRVRFNVSVDGGEPTKMMLYTGWNTICKDLEYGMHTVKFARASEGIDTQLYMTNVRTDGENPPVPTQIRPKRIEFLGDSYACGYGNLPEEIDNVKCPQNTDAWLAYPAMVARNYDADVDIVAVSGKGVCMNYATKKDPGINDKNVMPQQFLSSDMIRGSEEHQPWAFDNGQPQVMVIFLGTNDYNGSFKDGVWGAGSNPEYFVEKYQEMLGIIREKYPDTHILCVSKPFQCYHEELSVLIEEMAKQDDKLHRLVLEEFHASGIHGHPVPEQHQQTANYIIEAINAIPDVWGGEEPVVRVVESEDKSVSVFFNELKVDFDVKPVVVDDRTLVPMRAIFEVLGAQVDWNDKSQTATAVKDETKVAITIGGGFIVNEREVDLDVPAQLISDRTLVPLRAISESFGCQVVWEGYEVP